MADITWSEVILIASELTTVASGAQTIILAHVNTVLNAERFGGETSPQLKLARIYLAAHHGTGLGAVSGGGDVGEIASESMGGLSKSYVTTSTFDDSAASIGTTSYGRQYLQMVEMTVPRGPEVIM